MQLKLLKKNHSKTEVMSSDIRNINPLNCENKIQKNPFVIVWRSSLSGVFCGEYKTRNLENPNNLLYEEYIRL